MAEQPQTVVSVVYAGICKDYYGLDEQETHPFDCTGNPTSVGPLWRRWKRFFEFFIKAKGITKDTQNESYFCIALDRIYRAFSLR